MSIHPTAIVADGAVIPPSCKVGPFCTIGANVVLGEDCELVSHVVLDGHTTLGRGNRVFSFACLGIAPQDLKYAGEPTRLEIGDGNSIREYVTISRGTAEWVTDPRCTRRAGFSRRIGTAPLTSTLGN